MVSGGNITKSGSFHLNGNGEAAWGKIAKESFGLGVAELVSMGVSLGVVAVADQIAPNALDHASKVMGKILMPYVDPIQSGITKFCKLEECQPDMSKPREERAEQMAKTIMIIGAAGALSYTVKVLTRTGMNHLMNIPNGHAKTGNFVKDIMPKAHDLKIVAWDEGVHIGSMLWMNTKGHKHTDDMIRSTSGMLQKWGMPKQKADQVASMGIIWELPNVLGFGAGIGAIAHDHLNKR